MTLTTGTTESRTPVRGAFRENMKDREPNICNRYRANIEIFTCKWRENVPVVSMWFVISTVFTTLLCYVQCWKYLLLSISQAVILDLFNQYLLIILHGLWNCCFFSRKLIVADFRCQLKPYPAVNHVARSVFKWLYETDNCTGTLRKIIQLLTVTAFCKTWVSEASLLHSSPVLKYRNTHWS